MKILIISSEYIPVFNKNDAGAIQQLERLYITHNENLKDKITIYSPKISPDDYDRNGKKNTIFRVIDKTTTKYFLKSLFFKIAKKVLKEKAGNPYIKYIIKDLKIKGELNEYDLIIFENSLNFIPYFKNKTKTNTKIVLHLHNDYLNINNKNALNIIHSVDEIWTVSQYIKNRILEVSDKVVVNVLYNTYNPILLSCKNDQQISKLKKKFDAENNYIFLYVGRVIHSKGVRELIEAFKLFNKQYSNSKLVIVGNKEESLPGKKYYNNLLKNSNENIIFEGYIKPEKLREYYEVADTQIIPTITAEAFGIILLEGMNSNIKIIANDVGALKEIGEDMINYSDPDDLVHSLVQNMKKHYISNSKLPNDYYHQILTKYSADVYLNNMYTLIHKGDKDYNE